MNAAIAAPHADHRPFARTIPDAVRAAHRAAEEAPFVWVTGGDVSRIRGSAAERLEADCAQSFVSWNWDGRRLVVETDQFGLVPAYVYRSGNEVAISTSIATLVREGAALHLDRRALAVFLRLGFFVGEDTPFLEIRALPPRARMVWEGGHCDTTGGVYVVGQTDWSRDDAIDGAIDLTARAVGRRRPAAPFAVPLSGGRDSRHILLALHCAGDRPEFAVTVPRLPPSAPEDPRIAALVAAHLGVRHVVVDQMGSPAAAEARKNVATSYCADEHAWFYPMLDYVRGRIPLVYEGIGGSLWTVGWLPQRDIRDLWRSGRTHDVASRMLDRYQVAGEDFLADLLTDGDAWSRDVAVERLAEEVRQHVDAPDPGKSFHFWNRLRRELALVPFDQIRTGVADVRTPLVDADLVNFLLSLPPEVISPVLSRSDKSFHSEAIGRAFPEAAHLPFEDEAAPHADAAAHNRDFTTQVARHLLARKPLRVARSAYLLPRLAYTLARRRYAESSLWLAKTALYLAQIEDAAR